MHFTMFGSAPQCVFTLAGGLSAPLLQGSSLKNPIVVSRKPFFIYSKVISEKIRRPKKKKSRSPTVRIPNACRLDGNDRQPNNKAGRRRCCRNIWLDCPLVARARCWDLPARIVSRIRFKSETRLSSCVRGENFQRRRSDLRARILGSGVEPTPTTTDVRE